jgi:hypothetical protein
MPGRHSRPPLRCYPSIRLQSTVPARRAHATLRWHLLLSLSPPRRIQRIAPPDRRRRRDAEDVSAKGSKGRRLPGPRRWADVASGATQARHPAQGQLQGLLQLWPSSRTKGHARRHSPSPSRCRQAHPLFGRPAPTGLEAGDSLRRSQPIKIPRQSGPGFLKVVLQDVQIRCGRHYIDTPRRGEATGVSCGVLPPSLSVKACEASRAISLMPSAFSPRRSAASFSWSPVADTASLI